MRPDGRWRRIIPGDNLLNVTLWAEGAMLGPIEINPDVLQGKPVIRNTRIPVELLLRKLSEGATVEELLDAYPRITRDDIRACLAYAADTIAHEDIYSVSYE